MGVFIDSLAVALGGTVAASPIRTMVFQLQRTVVIFMAQQTAVLTNPLYAAVFTVVEVCDFGFLPPVSETKYIYLYWNSFYFDLLATQSANLLL